MRNTLKTLGCDYIYQDTPINVTSSLQIQREKRFDPSLRLVALAQELPYLYYLE